MARARDTLTSDLFSWTPPAVSVGYGSEVTGRGSLESQISRLVGQALREAKDEGLARADVAARMSEELGRTISVDMISKWASEASGEHRIPLDAFAALVRATGAHDLLGFLPALFGFVVVPRRFKGLVELHLLEEHEKDVAAQKAKIQADLRAQR